MGKTTRRNQRQITSPVKLTEARDLSNLTMVTHKIAYDGESIKVELPQYNNQHPEVFIKLVNDYWNMLDTYDLLSDATSILNRKTTLQRAIDRHIQANNGPPALTAEQQALLDRKNPFISLFNKFRMNLTGGSRTDWDTVTAGMTANERNLGAALMAIIRVVGAEAFTNLKNYMERTPKPKDMSVRKWVRRVQQLNVCLMTIDGGLGNHYTTTNLIKNCITPNIPFNWTREYKLNGGHKANQLDTIIDILEILESTDYGYDHDEESSSRSSDPYSDSDTSSNNISNNNQSTRSDNSNTKCKLPGHDHEWKDCPNNPKSTNFNGTSKLMKKGGKIVTQENNNNKNHEEKNNIEYKSNSQHEEHFFMEEMFMMDHNQVMHTTTTQQNANFQNHVMHTTQQNAPLPLTQNLPNYQTTMNRTSHESDRD